MSMRHHYYEIPAFAGMEAERTERKNTAFNTSLGNFRVVQGGIQTVHPPHFAALLPGQQENWPFPQVLRVGTRGRLWDSTFLLGRTKIYRCDETMTKIWTSKSQIPSSGYPWSFDTEGDFAVLCNYECTMFWTGRSGWHLKAGYWPEDGPIYPVGYAASWEVPIARCACIWNGQIIFGNYYAYKELRRRSVMWTDVMHGDARMEKLPDEITSVVGWLNLDWAGEIVALKSQASGPVVYGSQGVSRLVPAPHPAVYGEVPLSKNNVGIHGPLAVCGDENEHWFCDQEGNIWHVPNDGPMERLGFADHIPTGGARICLVMTYIPQWKEIRIGY